MQGLASVWMTTCAGEGASCQKPFPPLAESLRRSRPARPPRVNGPEPSDPPRPGTYYSALHPGKRRLSRRNDFSKAPEPVVF